MGSRGASSGKGGSVKAVGSMTTSQLKREDAVLSGKIESKGKEMEVLAREGKPSRTNPTGSIPEKYYTVQSERRSLQRRQEAVRNELGKRQKQTKSESKPFVNSYGEATKRNITSGTYERATKRTSRQIDNMFKGR